MSGISSREPVAVLVIAGSPRGGSHHRQCHHCGAFYPVLGRRSSVYYCSAACARVVYKARKYGQGRLA